MKIITSEDKSTGYPVLNVPGDTPGGRPFEYKGSEYFIYRCLIDGFLYQFTNAEGSVLYLWNCFDDVWQAVDPKNTNVNGREKPIIGQEQRFGYLDIPSRSFVYYLYKNASTAISYIYCGSDHTTNDSKTGRVIRNYQMGTIDLSGYRKWLVWRSTASRIASIARMVTSNTNNFNVYSTVSCITELSSLSKEKMVRYCVGVSRVMDAVGLQNGDPDGLVCDHHYIPQYAGYKQKGALIHGVDDIVPMGMIKEFISRELGLKYEFRSYNGTNNGEVHEDLVRKQEGFDLIEKRDNEFLSEIIKKGGRLYA